MVEGAVEGPASGVIPGTGSGFKEAPDSTEQAASGQFVGEFHEVLDQLDGVAIPLPVPEQDVRFDVIQQVVENNDGDHHIVETGEGPEDGFRKKVEGADDVENRDGSFGLLPGGDIGIKSESGEEAQEVGKDEECFGRRGCGCALRLGPAEKTVAEPIVESARLCPRRRQGLQLGGFGMRFRFHGVESMTYYLPRVNE